MTSMPSTGSLAIEQTMSSLDMIDQRMAGVIAPVRSQAVIDGQFESPASQKDQHVGGQALPPLVQAPPILDANPVLPQLDPIQSPIIRNDRSIIDFSDDGRQYLSDAIFESIDGKLIRIQDDLFIALQGILLLLKKYDLADALQLALTLAGAPGPKLPYVRAALAAGVLIDYAGRQLPPVGDPIHDTQNGLKFSIESMQIMWDRLKEKPDRQHLGILKQDIEHVTPWLVDTIMKLKHEIEAPIPEDPAAQLEARARKPQAEKQLKEALGLLRQLNQISNNVVAHDLPIDPQLLREASPYGQSLDPAAFHVPSVDLIDGADLVGPARMESGQVTTVRIDPIKLEVFVHDKRIEVRGTLGNRSIDVDMTRGPRLVGYMAI